MAHAGDAACAARLREGGKAWRATHSGSCHSGKSGRALSAASTALRNLIESQAFGQRIDRLDQRQAGEARFVDHAVGMHHLQRAVANAAVPDAVRVAPTGRSFSR